MSTPNYEEGVSAGKREIAEAFEKIAREAIFFRGGAFENSQIKNPEAVKCGIETLEWAMGEVNRLAKT